MPPAPSTWTDLGMQPLGGSGLCARLWGPPWSSPPIGLRSFAAWFRPLPRFAFPLLVLVGTGRFASGLQQMGHSDGAQLAVLRLPQRKFQRWLADSSRMHAEGGLCSRMSALGRSADRHLHAVACLYVVNALHCSPAWQIVQ